MSHVSTSCTAGISLARRQNRLMRGLPATSDQFDLERTIRLVVETVMAPRLDSIFQSIRDLAANEPRFDDGSTVYRLPSVLERVGVAKSTWYAWSNPKSASYDHTIPKGIKLGQHQRSPVVWRKREIEAWIEARASASSGPSKGAAA